MATCVLTDEMPVLMRLDNYQKVIVHCGFPKTGSSYIQTICDGNRSILAERGIDYPRFVRPRANKLHAGNHSIAVKSYPGRGDAWTHLATRLCFSPDCRTLLLSAEGFAKAIRIPGFLQSFLKPLSHAEVRFIFYVRRFDHLIESVYSQLVKSDFCGDISALRFSMHFGRKMAPLVAAVGRDNIVIRPYNRKLWPHGELSADFCSAIGIAELWREVQPENQIAVNASLSRPQVYLLSRLRSKEAKVRLLQWFSENPEALRSDGSRFFRSPEERRRFNAFHRRSGQAFADDFHLGDIGKFLDLDSFDDDPQWAPFVADWEMLLRCLPDTADFVEELAAGANREAGAAVVHETV